MKKLVFLAVVLIGITATSFAQTVANANMVTSIVPASSPNANLKIGYVGNLIFGQVTNNGGGVVSVFAAGTRAVDDPNKLTVSGNFQPASFNIEGAIQGTLALAFSQTHFPFGTGSWVDVDGITGLNQNTLFTTLGAVQGVNGKYLLKVGGTLHIAPGENGSYDLSGLSVTVNMQ